MVLKLFTYIEYTRGQGSGSPEAVLIDNKELRAPTVVMKYNV